MYEKTFNWVKIPILEKNGQLEVSVALRYFLSWLDEKHNLGGSQTLIGAIWDAEENIQNLMPEDLDWFEPLCDEAEEFRQAHFKKLRQAEGQLVNTKKQLFEMSKEVRHLKYENKQMDKERRAVQIPVKDQPGSKTVKIRPTKRKRKPIPSDL